MLSACSSYTYKPRNNAIANLPPGTSFSNTTQKVAPDTPRVEETAIEVIPQKEQKKITIEEAKALFTQPEVNEKKPAPITPNGKVDNSIFANTASARITALEEAMTSMGYRSFVITRFSSASSEVPEKGKSDLAKIDWAKMKVYRISGHSSVSGDPAKNTEISLNRANSVAQILDSLGADMTDHRLYGLGQTKRFGRNFNDNQAVVVIYKIK